MSVVDRSDLFIEFGKHAGKLFSLLPVNNDRIFNTLVYLLAVKHLEEKQSHIFSDPEFPLDGILFLDACGRLELSVSSDKIQSLCFAERYKKYAKKLIGFCEITQIVKIAFRCGIYEPIPPWFTYRRLVRVVTL